jgi:hypothetical protein
VDAADAWAELIAPWRAAAEARGFRPVKRTVERIAGGYRCVDRLLSGATWLDLAGELGATHGFWTATLTTWIDAGGARFSLSTIGEATPPPRPRGLAGWIAANLVAPLLHKLAPADSRPVPLRSPDDLARVIEKHMGELLAIAGKPVVLATLEQRLEQERADRKN